MLILFEAQLVVISILEGNKQGKQYWCIENAEKIQMMGNYCFRLVLVKSKMTCTKIICEEIVRMELTTAAKTTAKNVNAIFMSYTRTKVEYVSHLSTWKFAVNLWIVFNYNCRDKVVKDY